ncbi:MAG: ABC transporter substrate-binding protein [Anaerolineae bacterium]
MKSLSVRLHTVTSLLVILVMLVLTACAGGAPETPAPAAEEQPAATEPAAAGEGTLTDVGTPRHETLIVQTFDRKTANPHQHNPLMDYAIWRGFRELGWGYLWERDTATGESYPELAESMPEVLNEENTRFRIKLKKGIYWSDGVEFTADDVIYTLDLYFQYRDKLTYWGVPTITNFVKSYQKIDDYTFEIETVNPTFELQDVLGVYTWGSAFNIVPKHVFEKQEDPSQFTNTYPVTLGPYVVKEYDSNGFWQLWELREDWQRSAWGWMVEDGDLPKYVLYKDFGPEETRSLAFVNNEYDVDTFMSPASIKAAQKRNPEIRTFSDKMPYHNMDDACSYGILLNLQKPPLDKPEVRWALALSLDLKQVTINALNGEVKVSPLPMVDTRILRPIYFEPLLPWLNDFQLPDGYKPFNANFVPEFVEALRQAGIPDEEIPQGAEALSEAFGIGWWKYDPAEAEKLLNSVGITKNADGVYTLPDGSVWRLELVIPGDWNKVMQRVGFSVADSWQKAGFAVEARQVDNAEYGVVQRTNAQREALLNWTNCIFTPNYLNAWRTLRLSYVRPADSTELNNGNYYQWANERVDGLIAQASQMPTNTEEFYAIGREVIKEFVTDMAYINIMNIPTTIPTNDHYWTNFPKADNYYAVPYTWWSSFKKIVANVKPTGAR